MALPDYEGWACFVAVADGARGLHGFSRAAMEEGHREFSAESLLVTYDASGNPRIVPQVLHATPDASLEALPGDPEGCACTTTSTAPTTSALRPPPSALRPPPCDNPTQFPFTCDRGVSMKQKFVIAVTACAAVAMFVSVSVQGQQAAPAAPPAKPRGAAASQAFIDPHSSAST